MSVNNYVFHVIVWEKIVPVGGFCDKRVMENENCIRIDLANHFAAISVKLFEYILIR
jgi:hypothetical protein